MHNRYMKDICFSICLLVCLFANSNRENHLGIIIDAHFCVNLDCSMGKKKNMILQFYMNTPFYALEAAVRSWGNIQNYSWFEDKLLSIL